MTEEASLDDFIIWLNILELGRTVDAETIYTGRDIAEALHKIDGDFFDKEFLDRIPDYKPNASWPLKMNNLHKVYLRLSEFYKERLDIELTEKWAIDFRNAAEGTILDGVICLLKLVLAASVLHTVDQKYFISLLLKQSEMLQLTAMSAVQEIKGLMQQCTTLEGKSEENDAVTDSSTSNDDKSESKILVQKLSRENHRLLQQVKELKEERDQIVEQNKTLRMDLEGLGESNNEVENLRKQLRASQNLKENIQDSLYKVEAEREHYRKSAEEIAKENVALLEKLDLLAPLEEECRKAKDEVEEYRLRVLDFEKLNSQVEMYKAKLKEYNSQKVEIKVLEEKVSTYMQSVIALEDEQRKNGALKTQIESLRLENNDLGKKLREEVLRGDKAEFEIKRLSDRLKDAEGIKEQLREECRQLNEKVLYHGELPSKDSVSSLHDETMEANGFYSQERLLRLEKENEILKAKESDQIKLVKDELNVMAEKKAELESELKWSQRRIMELEAKLKDAEESIAEGEGISENRYSEQQAMKERLLLNVEQLEARLEQAYKVNESTSEEKEKLKEELKAAEQQVAAEKENLRVYMEKARRVIDDVEKQNRAVEAGSLSRHEFDAIRRERDSYKEMVENWEEKLEKSRTMHEEEQRLLTSYLYDMMMQRLLNSRTDDLTRPKLLSTPEKSFLSLQRQCCNFVR